MAGTITRRKLTAPKNSDLRDLVVQHNKVVTDLETLRSASRAVFTYEVEDLAANAAISARAIFAAPAAITVTSVVYVPRGNSAGVDGSNTSVVTLRNITEGVDVATITRTSNFAANTPVTVTITGANADVASGDVLGFTNTNGTTADPDAAMLVVEYQRQTVDAAADMTAAQIGNHAGTAYTA